MNFKNKILALTISLTSFLSTSLAATTLETTSTGLNKIPLSLLAVLSFLAITLIAVTYIGYDKPTMIAVGGIILLLLGLFIGWKGIVVKSGETASVDQLHNYTNYRNYSVNGSNESVVKKGAIKINGTDTTRESYEEINSDFNTFISVGYILAGLAAFFQTALIGLRMKSNTNKNRM